MPDDVTDTADMAPKRTRIAVVTGPSGSGRQTAVKALEDIGYEAIDNLPLSLLPRLLDGPPLERPLALGVDVRNRDFSVGGLLDAITALSDDPRFQAEVLYLDCSPDVLVRRYSETRRRHPLAPAEAPMQGIEREVSLLAPIKSRANFLIDTSELTPHDLRAEIQGWFGAPGEKRLAVTVQSFSYKRGIPRGLDMVFDCRFLRNPYWQAELRGLTGLDPAVAGYVAQDPRFPEFFDRLKGLLELLLPAFDTEGKSYLSIGLGCTGGQHRSVAAAEKLAIALAASGWQVSKRHREIERQRSATSADDAAIGEQT